MVGKRQEIAKEVASSTPQSFKKVSQVERIRQIIQAKILSVNKTRLTDLSKVFYLNKQNQKKGYFLLNTYQKPNILPDLKIGSTRSMLLVNGTKHTFAN